MGWIKELFCKEDPLDAQTNHFLYERQRIRTEQEREQKMKEERMAYAKERYKREFQKMKEEYKVGDMVWYNMPSSDPEIAYMKRLGAVDSYSNTGFGHIFEDESYPVEEQLQLFVEEHSRDGLYPNPLGVVHRIEVARITGKYEDQHAQ